MIEQLEDNVKESFRLAKNDIIQLQRTAALLSENQERLLAWLNDTREKETQLYQRVKDLKMVAAMRKQKSLKVAKTNKKYFASKNGKSFHIKSCPFAKRIKPKMKVIFKTKAKALNKGLKACECMKRI